MKGPDTSRYRLTKKRSGSCCLCILGSLFTSALAQNYGPDTCKQGYVWREAYSGDHVCVTPQVRADTVMDNRLAASRRSPTDRTYGPDTCKSGFVWREARSDDRTCVLPQTRAQVAADNRDAPNRYVAPNSVTRRMGTARPTDPNGPKSPPLKQLTPVKIDTPAGETAYELKFRTDVPASSGVQLSRRPPVCRGEVMVCQFDPATVVYRAPNTAGGSRPSDLHSFKIPYSRLVEGQTYYYVIDAEAAGRAHLQIAGNFSASVPHRIDY
jgi:hypothetical protein